MPGMIAPLVHLSGRPDLEVTRLADALSDVSCRLIRSASDSILQPFLIETQETVPGTLHSPTAPASTVRCQPEFAF